MKGKRLLSSECRNSGYVTGRKPRFTKLNILGNMKKEQLTRTLSSGGVSMRPAIVSATGGGLTSTARGIYSDKITIFNEPDMKDEGDFTN